MGVGDVGTARVVVEADTGLADAAFKKLQADAARAMDAIGRQRAQAEVGAKTTDFDRKIDNVKRKIAELDGTTANPNVKIDDDKAEADIEKLKLELKKLGAERATIHVDAKELRDANKLRDISAKKQSQMSKAWLNEQQAIDRATKSLERRAAATAKAWATEEKQVRQMGVMQGRAQEEDHKRTEESLRDVERLAKARKDYGKVLGDLQRVETKTGRPGGIFRTGSETRDLDLAKAKVEGLAREVERLGGSVDDINPSLEKNQGIIGRWLGGLSGVAVRIGPITASLKQLAVGAVVLGPVLTGLLGGLTSVVGVLGAGLAGAGAVGAAGFSGFVASAVGVGLVIKPLISQFGEAKKASEALSKAEIKYGKNSKQVKTAQEQLNHTLAGVDPVAKSAFKSYGQIGDQWAKLTKGAKPAVFNAFGQGLKTVQALLPEFAKESVATTKVAGKAFEGWVKSLRSSEAKKLLGQVMSNFRGSIPGIADGLASISAAFGRISASASKLLPGLSKGFAGWANGIEKSVGGGKDLDDTISRLVGDMQDIGHLAQSSGGLLVHLFDTSSESGDDLVQTLTKITDRWDDVVQSAAGQKSLKSFFSESAAETKEFFSVLAGLVKILFQIGRAGAPISAGFLKVLTVIGNLVSAATELVPLKGILEGVGAVLAAMWVGNKATAFASGIQDVARALYGMAAGEEAVAAAQANGGLGGLLMGGGKGGVKTAERDAEKLAKSAGEVGIATAGAGVAAEGAATSLAALALPLAAVAAPFVALTLVVGSNGEALEDARKAWAESGSDIPKAIIKLTGASNDYVGSQEKRAGVTHKLAAAEAHLNKLVGEKAPLHKRAEAVSEIVKLENQQAAAIVKTGQSLTRTVSAVQNNLTAAKARVAAAKEEIRLGNTPAKPGVGVTATGGRAGQAPVVDQKTAADKANLAAKGYHNLAAASKEVAEQQRQLALTMIPVNRELAGQAPITEKTYQGLKKLSTTIGGVATKKIGKFVNPGDVEQVTKLGNRLTKLGQGSTVKKIAVKSSGADETINKLQKVNKQSQHVEQGVTRLKVTADDSDATGKLRRVSQLAQKVLGFKAIMKILGNSSNAEQAAKKAEAAMRAAASKQYRAEISGIDKTHGPISAAQAKLLAVARNRYQARISAIDNASSPAKTAKSNLDKIKDKHATITVTGAPEAAAAAATVSSALDKIHDASATITTTYEQHGHPPSGAGNFAGGPSAYYSSYATGGVPNTRDIQRAADRAETRAGGSGGVIRRPTMLVGEQAPTYNEFVITENPAFRSSNRRYLTEAAGSIGMETVPAYATGKGGGKNKSSKGKKSAGGGVQDRAEDATKIKDPGPPPASLKAWNHNHKLPTTVNHGKGIALFNKLEGEISVGEGAYAAELNKEEREVEIYKNTKGAHGRSGWDFAKFKKMRKALVGEEQAIVKQAIPREIKDVGKVQKHAENVWATANGREETAKGKLHSSKDLLAKEESIYKHMHQNKHENSHEFADKKAKYKTEIEAQKKTVEKWEAQIEVFAQKKKEASKLEQEAKDEINTLEKEGGPGAQNALAEQGNELSTLEAIESGEIEAPYDEAPEPPKTPAELAKEAQEAQKESEENTRAGLESKIVEEEIAGPSATTPLKEAREKLLEYDEGALGRARLTPENSDDLEALNNIKSDKSALEEDAAGGTAKSIGEETASYNSARQSLYEQFASNITNGATAAGNAVVQAMTSSGFAGSAAAGLGARTTGGGFTSAAPSTGGGGSGTVNNVTNNFSEPPADPHTFTKNLLFELNAA